LKEYRSKIQSTGDSEFIEDFQLIESFVSSSNFDLDRLSRTCHSFEFDLGEQLLKDSINLKNLMKLHHHVKSLVAHYQLVEGQWKEIIEQSTQLEEQIGSERIALTNGNRAPGNLNMMEKLKWYASVRFIRIFYKVSAICTGILSCLIVFCEMTIISENDVSPLGAIVKADQIR
jgi:hypothetical protein